MAMLPTTSASAITCSDSMAGNAHSDSRMNSDSGVSFSHLRKAVTGSTFGSHRSVGLHIGDPAAGDRDRAPDQKDTEGQCACQPARARILVPESPAAAHRYLKCQ